MQAIEIKKPVRLCVDGRLNDRSLGWAKHPLVQCNVTGSYPRKKKWNYWCVTSPEVLFSATISHIDYAAVMFVYILDLTTKEFYEKTSLIPFGKGVHMPEGVRESLHYDGKDMRIHFDELDESTMLTISIYDFGGGKGLNADIKLSRPDKYESLNVVVPWTQKRFQFTSKQPAIPASGKITWGDKIYSMQSDRAFGCLDFGRGVWKYASNWNWGSASGVIDGQRIGLNFGGQWTDKTGQNENGFVINDRLHKIHDDINWDYDNNDYHKPWRLTTIGSDRVNLQFMPIFERIAETKAVIIKSSVHQLIGHYQGTIKTDDGKTIKIDSLLGWAEDHKAKW
ncbi:DUF2804 domain-containing protein [Oceanobacillus kimchii]|uniref:DUF2804 domain-containing protein n=1 Tax=Oceanobacillus kimchii TaxID=746691 RepID=UPI003B014956